jgi:small subunit ribosomal protein S21
MSEAQGDFVRSDENSRDLNNNYSGFSGGDRQFSGGDRQRNRSDSNRGERYNDNKTGRDKSGAMEVIVEHNIEKAMKVLKRKMIKEGIFRELKSRRYYEKPSDRKKRKLKESIKKIRKESARSKKNQSLMF